MKGKVLVKSFCMGMICPAVIYAIQAAIDIITQESAALFLMAVEGFLLFILPIFFLSMEKKLKDECSTKWTAPVYLCGYGAAVLISFVISMFIDTGKLFPHQFLGGIGLGFLLFILLGGFCWAIVFRLGALVVSLIKKTQS